MEGEKTLQPSPMPLIPRLDRLDHLLNYLEEQHSSSRRYPNQVSDSVLDQQAKPVSHVRPLASVLEEVPSRGSLMERVVVLENRILQLYNEMDVGEMSAHEEGEDAPAREEMPPVVLEKRSRRRVNGVSGYRRLFRWIHITC